MGKYLLVLTLLLTSVLLCFGKPIQLENFIVKENLLKNDKLAIIAAGQNEEPIEELNGTFTFSVNGFRQELKFHDGIAVTPQAIDKSTFVYLKHQNDSTSTAKLYYVWKGASGINPIKVHWSIFILVPLLLVIIANMFRKFIVFAVLIMIGMFYFNLSNGLSMPTYFDTIIEGLKSFIL